MTSIIDAIQKRRIFILGFVFIALVGTLGVHVFNAVGDGKYFLLHEDEVIYYCSGKLFAATNSVRAEGCIDENVSRIGEMNWYGPGYSIIYGTVFKVFGDGPTVFIWFNVALAAGCIILLFFLQTSLENRLIIINCLMLTQQFNVYIFTYFPETLVIFLATVLSVLLANYSLSTAAKASWLTAFIVCVFIFMMVRVTFIFWLVALVPFAKNRKQFALRLLAFVGCVFIALLYMRYFTAPPYAGSMHKINYLFSGNIPRFLVETVSAVWSNVRTLLVERTSATNVLISLVIIVGIFFIRKKNPLAFAGVLISLCVIGVLFAYYIVGQFYFIKQSDMLLPLLIVAIIVSAPRLVFAYGLLIVIMIVYPSPLRKMKLAIEDGRNAFVQYQASRDFKNSLNEIANHIQGKSTNILYCYNEFPYGNAAEALLPFATKAGNPILYTTNIVDPNADPTVKFVMHNRLKIHYILSMNPLVVDSLKEVHATPYYHLYQLPNSTQK